MRSSVSANSTLITTTDEPVVLVNMRSKRTLPAIFTAGVSAAARPAAARNSLASITSSSLNNKFETGSLPRRTVSRGDSFYESVYAELEKDNAAGADGRSSGGSTTPISRGAFRARYEDAIKG
jgi:hypothetical protein